MNKDMQEHVESLIEDIIDKSLDKGDEANTLDKKFQEQVDKWISQFDEDKWMEKFACFIAEQLFEHGYNVIVAIDVDSYWNTSLKVVRRRKKEYETEVSEDFFLRNTFLDIFAVDRKVSPMIFDDRMNDPDFSKDKMREIIECHMNLVTGQLEGMTHGEIYDDNQEKFDAIIKRRKSYEQHV